ncbi:MAG: HAD family phosphatase [Opitutales bacterium]|nr:HAD family phosphatase [Opitutales bacterium]
MFGAALFDWDGVVVDSSAAHKESWEILAREEGLPLEADHFAKSFGRTNKVIIPEVYRWTNVPSEIARIGDRKEVLYREIISSMPAEKLALPGAVELLHALKAAGIPAAVGSSTARDNITLILGKLGIADCFGGMITAENVSRGKPDPEVFLKGAEVLGVAPADCVVFEDAVYGVEAAMAGGMKSVAVLTTHSRECFVGKASLIVDRLTEITLPKLAALWH